MIHFSKDKCNFKIQKSNSCKDLYSTKVKNAANVSQSSEELPKAVAECFQNASLLSRMQNSFMLFIGRGSKYKLKLSQQTPFESPNKTANEFQDFETSCPSNLANGYHNSLPSKSKLATHNNNRVQLPPPETSDDSKYSNTKSGNQTTEEESIFRQYLSLQQLAISRRHCNQLRRIRDSLAGKATQISISSQPSSEQRELRNFLMDVGFVQYYTALNRHGYDLRTATHMDVLDLAAVGVCEPLHRMALKYELQQIKLPVEPLSSVPETVVEWLQGIGIPEYTEHFQQNGFYCPLSAVGLTKRDLQLMGIYMLGHRKKLVLSLQSINMTLASTGANYHKKNSL